MRISSSASRLLSPIPIYVSHFHLLRFFPYWYLEINFPCALSYLFFFPSLDNRLTFCEFLSVFPDAGRVCFIYLTLIYLLSIPSCLLFLTLDQHTWFVCYLKCMFLGPCLPHLSIKMWHLMSVGLPSSYYGQCILGEASHPRPQASRHVWIHPSPSHKMGSPTL
jgi:hypothetical protein